MRDNTVVALKLAETGYYAKKYSEERRNFERRVERWENLLPKHLCVYNQVLKGRNPTKGKWFKEDWFIVSKYPGMRKYQETVKIPVPALERDTNVIFFAITPDDSDLYFFYVFKVEKGLEMLPEATCSKARSTVPSPSGVRTQDCIFHVKIPAECRYAKYYQMMSLTIKNMDCVEPYVSLYDYELEMKVFHKYMGES